MQSYIFLGNQSFHQVCRRVCPTPPTDWSPSSSCVSFPSTRKTNLAHSLPLSFSQGTPLPSSLPFQMTMASRANHAYPALATCTRTTWEGSVRSPPPRLDGHGHGGTGELSSLHNSQHWDWNPGGTMRTCSGVTMSGSQELGSWGPRPGCIVGAPSLTHSIKVSGQDSDLGAFSKSPMIPGL